MDTPAREANNAARQSPRSAKEASQGIIMTDTTQAAATPQASLRLTGAALIATGIASIALLLNHPGGAAQDFAGVLKEESANRGMDALVHGGFIVVLAVQLACYAILSARLARPAAIAAMVFFAVGCAFQMGSLLTDGLIIPALAARYVTAIAAKQDQARALFALCGTAIQFLMPGGLLFQAAGVAAWGAALIGKARAVGLFALALGALLMAAIAATFGAMNPFVLMGAIAGLALWAVVAGLTMQRRGD